MFANIQYYYGSFLENYSIFHDIIIKERKEMIMMLLDGKTLSLKLKEELRENLNFIN